MTVALHHCIYLSKRPKILDLIVDQNIFPLIALTNYCGYKGENVLSHYPQILVRMLFFSGCLDSWPLWLLCFSGVGRKL